MDISKSDRDALRASQHKLNPNMIGNIIEHKIQNPKQYKQQSLSRPKTELGCVTSKQTPTPAGQQEAAQEMPEIHHESIFLPNEQNGVLPSIKEDLDSELPDDIKEFQANSWLNMNQVEFDKLEWMSSKAVKMHQDRLERTTQFNREGKTVSVKTLAGKKNGTAPQGEDASHDIESLIKLLDSAFDPQVSYSLNVISGIAALANLGYYDGAFDENIHDVLLKGCLLRVRHHIDSSNETTCLSALKCMRSLICNTQVDEVILDRVHPIISENIDSTLWLHTIEMDSKEFSIEMKDYECVEVDTILGLICRTDLLKRFSHLFENKNGRFSFAYYDCMLDILIRIARHSAGVCYILSRKDFIPSIMKTLLPPAILTESKQVQQLTIKALKLMRIIAQAAQEMSVIHLREPNQPTIDHRIFNKLVPSIEAYFLIDCYSLPGNDFEQIFKLHIETLRTMKALCRLEQFRAKMISVIAMAHGKMLNDLKVLATLDSKKQIDSKISIDWQYAAHLIDLIGSIMYCERYHNIESNTDIYWTSFIKPIIFQWLTDIIRLKCIPHLDVSITIAAAVRQYNARADEKAKQALHAVMIEPIIMDNMESRGVGVNLFMLLARTASERSQLHNFLQRFGRLRDPKGLPSYGCLNYNLSAKHNFKLSPLFDNDSPFFLLNTFIHQLPREQEGIRSNMDMFIDSPNISRYIRTITGYHRYQTNYESMVQQSLIAQYEVHLISHALLLLNSYYLDYSTGVKTYKCGQELEPSDLTSSRVECYSNLCYYAICAMGLINTNSDFLIELKDKLFEKLLLNSRLQDRITSERFEKPTGSTVHKPTSNHNHVTGIDCSKTLTADYLNVLVPLYLSCDHLNRFWILQPILEYYLDQINRPDEAENQKSGQAERVKNAQKGGWFRSNVPWRMHTGELASANDNSIVTTMLVFNSTMMLYSPSYLHLVIKPDIEDYLCFLGTLFLDDDLFLDRQVNQALENNLRVILDKCIEMNPSTKVTKLFSDASRIIKPLELPLADFFDKLVNQYEAVSYGDATFSNFLLLFITTGSDLVFRKKLFQEKSETCLSQLRLSGESLWAPKELFLGAKEKDPEMRELLRRAGAFIHKHSFLSSYRDFHISS